MIFFKYHLLPKEEKYEIRVINKPQKIDRRFKSVGEAERFLLNLNYDPCLKIEAYPSFDGGLTYNHKKKIRLI